MPIWQRNVGEYYWYKKLEHLDALYIQINRVLGSNSGDFLKFVESLPKPSESEMARLIIDFRTNRGGDASILQPLLHSIIRYWNYLEPGKIFVLISNYTFSAAVHLAAELESNTHAIFVGSPTAAPPNHYADVKRIALPNSGIEVEISSLYWQKSDPRDLRYAIYPDIEVEISGSDFIQNKDPVLDSVSNINPDSAKLNRDNFSVFNWFRESQKKQ